MVESDLRQLRHDESRGDAMPSPIRVDTRRKIGALRRLEVDDGEASSGSKRGVQRLVEGGGLERLAPALGQGARSPE